MEKKIKITWKKSTIGRTGNQRETVRSLGFRRLHQTLIVPDRPQIRGMIKRVSHLLEVADES